MCGALVLGAQAAQPRIDYTLTPVLAEGALQAVQIDLRFRGDADGETRLRLPGDWGGETELYRAVTALEAVSGAALNDGGGPTQRVLTHRPNARVHVRYRIVQDHAGAPRAGRGNAYRAVVQPGYFHLIGEAIMVTPEEANMATPVRFNVRRLPQGWAFASDLEHQGLTLAQVWGSISVGGDFRITHGADRNIRVAMRGAWSFSDESFAAQVSEIVAGQRRFWRDPSTPYLVTVLPLEQPQPGWRSVGGTGLSDAFAFFATDNAESAGIVRTLAHESLHTWIPFALGGLPQEDQALDYWLSEGFTDFYTGRLLVRDGVWNPQAFAADLNSMLRAYAFSSARDAPNARIGEIFWSDGAARDIPYQRGRLLATIWDQRLRARGSSLDALMHDMRTRLAAGEAGPAVPLFMRTALAHGLDVGADRAAYIEGGAAILLPEDVFAPCGRIVTFEAAPFHRGFDIDATSANHNTITGVDPASPAYAAGLRDGMVILARDGGEIGNADVELVYRLRDGDGERVIRYLPRGRGLATVQRFELAEALDGEILAQCRHVLAGAS